MALVSMGPMLRHARANGYGIAAYNMIDYNSAASVIAGWRFETSRSSPGRGEWPTHPDIWRRSTSWANP